MYVTHKNQVKLAYTGKQSQQKAQNKLKQVDKDLQAYLKEAGPFASASSFCSRYGYRQGGGRADLARQLFEWTQETRKERSGAQQRAAAKQQRNEQEEERRILSRAEAWFYGTELGSAYISQMFRLCNRDDLSDAGLRRPTAGQVAYELRRTLTDCGRDDDVRLMEPLFAKFLRMKPAQLADHFREAFRLPSAPGKSRPYYRAEVLAGRFAHKPGDVLRTQAPTSVSTSEEKAASFLGHRKEHGSERVLYTFAGVPTRPLNTALNVSSTGEGEAIVPDRTDVQVIAVERTSFEGEPLVRVTLGPAKRARADGWDWMGHDAGLSRATGR
ncbi:hypothetical protein ACIBEA_21695 [Streptomyces sp. NPDC051555]|uniref:hypothetical protein n=1 Tax=Streptomyces sp. NPDC051555 TaxID=3365657 RepID=UPI003792C7B0